MQTLLANGLRGLTILFISAFCLETTSLRATAENYSRPPATADFALGLFKSISETKDNVLFSPYSISAAMGMVALGAQGNTRAQIINALGLGNMSQPERILAEVDKKIKTIEQNGALTLQSANALWIDQAFSILPSYQQGLHRYYSSEIFAADFQNSSEKERLRINLWVGGKTNDKINDLLAPKVIDHLTRLVLINAVYFNASWQYAFDQNKTADDVFLTADGRKLKTKFMRLSRALAYKEENGFQVVQLPYLGDSVSMYVLLPGDRTSSAGSLTRSMLINLDRDLKLSKVNLRMPVFKMEVDTDLNRELKKLGITDAFSDGQADFSGISESNEVYLSKVIHKAYIAVDEKGTEAAAATAVIMQARSAALFEPEEVDFIADHPFIFLIKISESDQFLFMGRLAQP